MHCKKSVNKVFFLFPLIYFFSLSFFSLSSFPSKIVNNNFFPYLADKPVSEDGYYMLTTADNIARGKGIVYNFSQPTTGIQPLATFFYAGVAKFVYLFSDNKSSFVRAVIAAAALLELLFVFIIYRIALLIAPGLPRNKLLLFSTFFSLLNFKLFIYFANGLETGLYLVCFGITLIYSFKFAKKRTYSSALVFGILAGLTALARLDFLAVLAVFFLSALFVMKIKFSRLLIAGCMVLAVLSPWLYYVYTVTGSLLQTSITAQASLNPGNEVFSRFTAMFYAVLQHLLPLFYTSGRDYLLLAFFPFIIAGIVFLYKKGYFKKYRNNIIYFWLYGVLFLLPLYFIISFASYFYLRYSVPLLAIILPYTAVFAAELFDKYTRRRERIAGAICLALFFTQAYFYFNTGHIGVQQCLRVNFIKSNFSSATKIGVWQSGVTGFYCNNVVNLDGKLNIDAYRSMKQFSIYKYIDAAKIDAIIEWKVAFKNIDTTKWKLFSSDIGDGKTECWKRR